MGTADNHGVFYVQDASKFVSVASALLSEILKPQLLTNTKADYEIVRKHRANKGKSKPILSTLNSFFLLVILAQSYFKT